VDLTRDNRRTGSTFDVSETSHENQDDQVIPFSTSSSDGNMHGNESTNCSQTGTSSTLSLNSSSLNAMDRAHVDSPVSVNETNSRAETRYGNKRSNFSFYNHSHSHQELFQKAKDIIDDLLKLHISRGDIVREICGFPLDNTLSNSDVLKNLRNVLISHHDEEHHQSRPLSHDNNSHTGSANCPPNSKIDIRSPQPTPAPTKARRGVRSIMAHKVQPL